MSVTTRGADRPDSLNPTLAVRAVQPTRRGFGAADAAPGALGGLLAALVWFALLASLVELAILGWRKLVAGEVIGMGPQALWLTPAADLLFFALAGAPALLAARLAPRLVRPAFAAGWLGFLAALAALLMFERLHTYAVLVLAAGVGVQVARWAATRPAGFARVVRASLPPLAGLVVVLASGTAAYGLLRERRAVGALPAAAEGAPNVLLLILDTVRARSLSLYGHTSPTTPNLERLARQGVVFDWAIAPAPWTLPSHAAMFTGRYSHEIKAGWGTPMETGVPTIAEAFGANGYRTAAFVANLEYATYERGLARGFQRYEDFESSWGQLALSSSVGRYLQGKGSLRNLVGYQEVLNRKRAPAIAGDFLRWQRSVAESDARRPWFAFLNFFDAHLPYLPPEPFASKFGHGRQWTSNQFMPNAMWWLNTDEMPDAVLKAEQGAYEGAIAALDHEIGLLMAELERRGQLENTIVVITSDHGEEFKEKGVVTHAHSIYVPALHVPLLVVAPGRAPAGLRVAEPVSLRDLPATLMELAEPKKKWKFPGHSLARAWRPEGAIPIAATPLAAPSHVLSQLKLLESFSGPKSVETRIARKSFAQSVIQWPHHFIRYRDGSEELYDLAKDPWEQTDLLQQSPKPAEALRPLLPPDPGKAKTF